MLFLINLCIALIVVLAIANFVVSIARMDQRYAAKVRQEFEKKSYLRGEHWDDHRH